MSNNDQFDDLDDFDDFDEIPDDTDTVSEDGATEEEDWNQFSEDETGSETEPGEGHLKKGSAKKKSGFFSILLIGGIILAGAGFMFLQTGGKKDPLPLPAQQEPLIEDQIAEVPEPPDTPPMPSPIEQPETQPDLALQDAKTGAESVLPSAINADEALPAPAVEEPVMRMPKVEDILLKGKTEAPVATAPVVEPAEQVIPTGSLTSGNPNPAAEQISSPAVSDGGLLMEKLDELTARLESLEAKLEVYRQEKPAAAQNESGETDARIDAMQQSLARLESQMKQSPARNQTPADPEPQRQAVDPPPAKPVPQILGHSATEPETTQPVRPPAPAPAWVLKGAQPGRAMLAKKGENDPQPVEVGDTLPGVGRITAIEYKNGKWSVIGTSGIVSQ